MVCIGSQYNKMASYTTSSFVKENFSFRPSYASSYVHTLIDFGNTHSYQKQNFSFRPSYATAYALATLSFVTSSYATVMGNSRTVTPQIPNKTIYPRTP